MIDTNSANKPQLDFQNDTSLQSTIDKILITYNRKIIEPFAQVKNIPKPLIEQIKRSERATEIIKEMVTKHIKAYEKHNGQLEDELERFIHNFIILANYHATVKEISMEFLVAKYYQTYLSYTYDNNKRRHLNYVDTSAFLMNLFYRRTNIEFKKLPHYISIDRIEYVMNKISITEGKDSVKFTIKEYFWMLTKVLYLFINNPNEELNLLLFTKDTSIIHKL